MVRNELGESNTLYPVILFFFYYMKKNINKKSDVFSNYNFIRIYLKQLPTHVKKSLISDRLTTISVQFTLPDLFSFDNLSSFNVSQ